MSKEITHSRHVLMLLVIAVLLLWATQVPAQTTTDPSPSDPVVTDPVPETPDAEEPIPAEPEDLAPDTSNPPPYMDELLERTDLTEAQMLEMRSNDAGWGEIRIATLLAEQMTANSADTDTPLTFDEALAAVLAARAEGLGYGEIAQQNDLQIGRLLRNRNRVREPALGDGLEAEEGVQAGEAVQVRGRKRSVFAQLAGFLGFGKAERPDKLERPIRSAGSARDAKPERPNRPDKLERPERPERPEKPEKPEKPERPAKPEKPERPERGPRR